MAAPQGGGALSYFPEPHERPYFDGLFQAADTQRTGNIGGQQAVAFFSRSKLPIEQLKNVWTVADNPATNALDKRKFAVALRLIQLLQNGVKGQGANLAAPPGVNLRPVYFEGVSGTSVPMPNQQQQQQQQQQQKKSPQQQQPTPQQHPPPQQLQQQQQRPPQGPPGGSPQGGPMPSPQQQQQQQPPQQQLQGGRPPMAPQNQSPLRSATPNSMALTVQDPYTLTPSERARYESLFPQYAKEDGYMHGKEAVELFSKSGLSSEILRDIWNMADQPVDNKLDKLEFAIAMHLIVCVSKKNLPMPKGLPISLKQLKQQHHQEQQQQQSTPSQQQQQQQQQPGIQSSPSWGSQQQGMPQSQQQHMQPSSMQQPHMQQQTPDTEPPNRIHAHTPTNESVMSGMTGPTTTMQGPPPITSAGGMDISDAFEGLSTTSADNHGSETAPTANGFGSAFGSAHSEQQHSYGGTTNNEQQSSGNTGQQSYGMESSASQAGQHSMPGNSEATPIASPPRMQESTYAKNQYQPSSTSSQPAPELQKAPEALAKAYDMDDAHGELDKLKNVLQKLQAENISLKAQLGTMSDEERDVQKQINATVHEISELSSHLTDLRAQVLASRTRLLEKTAELKAAQEKKGTTRDLIGEAEATKEAIESAYQGLEDSIHAAHAPAPQQAPAPSFEADLFGFGGAPARAPVPAPTPSYESNSHAEAYQSNAPSPFPAPAPAPIPYGNQQVETVSEDDTSAAGGEDFEENPEGEESQHQADWSQQQQYYNHDQPDMGHGSQNSAFGLEHLRALPKPGHNKQSSISSQLSFDRDGIMGGASIPASQFPMPPQEDNQYNQNMAQNAPSLKDVEDLKKRAKEAADIARDAEDSLRQLMAQADELRTVADKAEMEARQKASQATEKKGGLLGGGKKKKNMKEAEKAKQDAEEKKKKFLAAQAQANDAQAVAMETKREAEKLRKEAEKCEMDAASAASMQHKQPAPAPAQQPSNGGQSNRQQNQGYGIQQQPSYDQQQQGYGGYGGNPYGGFGDPGGYNPSVMAAGGGGGIEIPSPSAQGNDPYSNPFG